jgi:hypothetical protein
MEVSMLHTQNTAAPSIHLLHVGEVSPWIAETFSSYYQPQPAGREHLSWIVCYREEEADEFEGCAFGTGATFWLALADLMTRYPREV